mgnify:CR=1 FL=1
MTNIGVKQGYINLAAAILSSAVRDNDTYFLKSDFGQALKEYVGAYMNRSDCIGTAARSGRANHVSI